MSKKKKNSNYVTEKRENAKKEAERKERSRVIRTRVLAISIPLLVIAAIVVTLILVGGRFGWWDKKPVATQHAAITVSGYGTLHVELYGDNAPETVAAFTKLVEAKKYNNIRFDKLKDGKLETTKIDATETFKGEFEDNGVENTVKFKKGTLVMALADGPDSANGEFFIVTEDNKDLYGKYAAFGRIDEASMPVLDAILEDLAREGMVDAEGMIKVLERPKITSVAIHEPH